MHNYVSSAANKLLRVSSKNRPQVSKRAQWLVTELPSSFCKSGHFKRSMEEVFKFSSCFWEPCLTHSYLSCKKELRFPQDIAVQLIWAHAQRRIMCVSLYIYVLYLVRQAIEKRSFVKIICHEIGETHVSLILKTVYQGAKEPHAPLTMKIMKSDYPRKLWVCLTHKPQPQGGKKNYQKGHSEQSESRTELNSHWTHKKQTQSLQGRRKQEEFKGNK